MSGKTNTMTPLVGDKASAIWIGDRWGLDCFWEKTLVLLIVYSGNGGKPKFCYII